jgi:hypothetical protein
VLRWASVSGRTEPTAAEKDNGLAEGDGLPAEYLNDSLGVAGDWTDWIDDRLFDAYTIPTMGSDCRLTGDPDEGLTVANEAATLLPVNCAQPVSDAVNQAVTVAYLTKCIMNFIGFEHDYDSSPLEIVTATKTYMPFSDFTPTITGQGVNVNASTLEFDEVGIYHIDVSLRWVNGPASAYARSLIVDVGGTEHRAFLHNEVSGAVARTQQYSLDVEIGNISTDILKVAAYQASGSSDYVQVVNVTVHQVAKRVV